MKFNSDSAGFSARLLAFVIALGFIALLLFFAPLSVVRAAPQATTWTVTSTGDGAVNLANCPHASNCRLRDAIAASAVGDTIAFSLTLPATITLINGQLIIAGLTINGPGEANLAISGNNASRVFDVDNSTIGNLTIRDGNSGSNGGGISTANILTLTNVTVISNTALYGAGIYNNGGIMLFTNVTVKHNFATLYGGGIVNNNNSGPTRLTLINSTVSNNTAGGDTGGIGNGGTLTITGSTLFGNQSGGDGGAIFNSSNATVTLASNVFLSNTAASRGGAIYNEGTMTLISSSIQANRANGSVGGGIYNDGTMAITNTAISNNVISSSISSGGGIYNSKFLTITGSTINGNASVGSSNSNGGAVYMENSSSVLTLNNVTVSGNTSTSPNAVAGGLRLASGTANLNNVTISKNSTTGDGGGISNNGTFNFKNTIIAGNTASTAPDCYAGTSLNSQDYNLIGNVAGCTIGGATGNNVTGDPKLTPLASLGGPTQVHGLLAGSPALNAGNNATCLATDQRGIVRALTIGDKCDMGAFEGIAFALDIPLIMR